MSDPIRSVSSLRPLPTGRQLPRVAPAAESAQEGPRVASWGDRYMPAPRYNNQHVEWHERHDYAHEEWHEHNHPTYPVYPTYPTYPSYPVYPQNNYPQPYYPQNNYPQPYYPPAPVYYPPAPVYYPPAPVYYPPSPYTYMGPGQAVGSIVGAIVDIFGN